MHRPAPSEYAPHYRAYIERVPEGDIREILARQISETTATLRTVAPDRETFRYAPGKWSVREVAGHVADTERVMAYRMLRIARGDTTPLPGFDENKFVAGAGFDRRLLADIVTEFELVRAATLALLRTLGAEALRRTGTASGHSVSARALAYIIAGHELHHLAILRERYEVIP